MEAVTVVLLVAASGCMYAWRRLSGERRNVAFIVGATLAIVASVCCLEYRAVSLVIVAADFAAMAYFSLHTYVYHTWWEWKLFHYGYEWKGPIRSGLDIWHLRHPARR